MDSIIPDISKPADTLIKKVSDAIGGVFKPTQIKRVAKAEAEAAITKAKADIEISALHQRAIQRFINEEAARQANIENITARALPHLNKNAEPENVENDWIVNFFDKSRLISDAEMQEIWARILAGEANAPGSFSKRSVDLLSSMDKADALSFARLCDFMWKIGDQGPYILIFEYNGSFYRHHGINFDLINHLNTIGLVSFEGVGEYVSDPLGRVITVSYHDTRLQLTLPGDESELRVGEILLTSSGKQLAAICHTKKIDGFVDYATKQWKVRGVKVEKIDP